MSKRPASAASKGAIPKQPSKTSVSKSQKKGKDKPGTSTAGKGKKDPKKDVVEWQLPAFSVPPPKKKEINWERLRKDTARRHSPEGEDMKELRRILKEVKGVDVPVHEFINMIGPYSSDNGAALRSVMAEDLESFRQLARKVYETMTQDVSDVLVNEQLQMVEYYEEKTNQLSDKMMRAINEIYEMAPTFEFEKFLRLKDEYLRSLFPMPKEAEAMMSDEACEMVRRQQAYHRLQWIKSEGERMTEENKRLLRRLEDLKKQQQIEQNRAADIAAEAETKRQELSKEENQMKETLEKLNESIEKSFIREEMRTTREHNKTVMEQKVDVTTKKSTGAIPKTRSAAGLKKSRRKPDWSSATAADMEEEVVQTTVAAETRKTTSRTTVKRPKAARTRHPPKQEAFHYSPTKTPPQETFDESVVTFGKAKAKKAAKPPSPFHYSPSKSPPQDAGAAAVMPEDYISFGKSKPKRAEKPPSPFHYSPPKSPPEQRRQMEESTFSGFGEERSRQAPRQTSPFHYSPPKAPPPQVQETRIEESSTTVQQRRPQPRIRQTTRAPKDSWGGFY